MYTPWHGCVASRGAACFAQAPSGAAPLCCAMMRSATARCNAAQHTGRCGTRIARGQLAARAQRGQLRVAAMLPFFGNRNANGGGGNVPAPPKPEVPTAPPKFDLPLGVVLAGAAFEAYLQPQGAEGLQQRVVGGPTVTYTDKSFLLDTYQGMLRVQVVRARNLRPADPNGLSDPYAVVSVANCSFRTATVSASLNPDWKDETHWMYIRNPETDVVRIRMFDADTMKSDDDLGLAMASIKDLQQGGKKALTLPLRGPGAGQGATVDVVLRYVRFEDTDPADLARLTSQRVTAPSATAMAGVEAAAAQVAGAAGAVPQLVESVVSSVMGTPDTPAAGQQQLQLQDGAAEPGPASTLELPSGEEVPNPWRVLAEMVGRTTSSGSLTPVAFVDNDDTDTQVWIYRNVELKEAVVAFRGTEQVKWKDIVTDLNLTPASLNPERVDDNAGLPFTVRIFKAVTRQTEDQLMVHKGFLTAYDSVRREVFTLVDQITGAGERGTWRVLVTGHSLGGALATLAAFELAKRQSPSRPYQQISMYSYGAPRVGNKTFADQYDALVPDTWRITNSNDIVPSVPRLMGYCHVGHGVRLTEEGKLKVRAETTDVFGEGKAGMEVIQEIVTRVSEEAVPWDEVYSEIAAREMQLLDAMVGGKGLEEHMETFYLASLQQAVGRASDQGKQQQQQ